MLRKESAPFLGELREREGGSDFPDHTILHKKKHHLSFCENTSDIFHVFTLPFYLLILTPKRVLKVLFIFPHISNILFISFAISWKNSFFDTRKTSYYHTIKVAF